MDTSRPDQIHIRSARPSDASALRRCAIAAYERYIPLIGKVPAPMGVDYAKKIATADVWVATADRCVIGLMVLKPGENSLLLDNVAVMPAHTSQGVGRRLIRLAERRARRRGYAAITLYTHERMTENHALYLRYGYCETCRATKHGYTRIYFQKRLLAARMTHND